jgi:hypothetical protein
MVDNGGTDATPRSRALCGGFCGELSRSALFSVVFFIFITYPINRKFLNKIFNLFKNNLCFNKIFLIPN